MIQCLRMWTRNRCDAHLTILLNFLSRSHRRVKPGRMKPCLSNSDMVSILVSIETNIVCANNTLRAINYFKILSASLGSLSAQKAQSHTDFQLRLWASHLLSISTNPSTPGRHIKVMLALTECWSWHCFIADEDRVTFACKTLSAARHRGETPQIICF